MVRLAQSIPFALFEVPPGPMPSNRSDATQACDRTVPLKPLSLSPLFAFGLLFSPLLVVAHELGHAVVGTFLGFDIHLSYAAVRYVSAGRAMTDADEVWITLGGPMVELTLCAAGLVWLVRRRANGAVPVTRADWLATAACVLCAARWLRAATGTPSLPQPADEALLSGALGLPVWALPYGLAPLALWVIVVAIHLHPSGARFLPFAGLFCGAGAGLFLWFRAVGPWLLPPV